MDTPVKVAVVGCGNWGKNLVRNFYSLGALVAVCDLDKDGLARLKKQYPGIEVTSRLDDLLENPDIHALVISTPSQTHHALAKAALLAGKHVYVEKPMATSIAETEELHHLSAELGKTLMVGHLLMYHPVVNRLKQLIESGYLGDVRYIESDRLNMNPYRSDRTVFWDLAPHDLSMMMYILGRSPRQVLSVHGSRTGDDGLLDVAHLEVEFEGGINGHIHNSWVHPVKQVKLVVRGSERTAVMDDTLPMSEKLQIFNHNAPPERYIPESLNLEPLKLECQHFLNCVITGRRPKSDSVNGLEIVRILSQAEHMIQENDDLISDYSPVPVE